MGRENDRKECEKDMEGGGKERPTCGLNIERYRKSQCEEKVVKSVNKSD